MRLIILGTAASLVLAGCGPQGSVSLDTDDQKASYGYGLNVGSQFQPTASLLDVDAFVQGFRDALEEVDPRVDPMELQTVMQEFSNRVQQAQMDQMEAQGEANRAEGEAYLAENAGREGVVTTESGLQYEVLEEGDGPQPGPQDQVTIYYTGTLVNGEVFDSTEEGQPATFGVGGVIPGFSEGLQLMPVGSTYRFVIPSDLAYGPQGPPSIGPDATLIFEVELLEIGEN